jgi:uncharacterized repeat protein (TIGR02543 family)
MKRIKTGAAVLLAAALLMAGMPAAFADAPPTAQTLKPTRMYLYYSGNIVYETGRYQTEDVRAGLNGSVNPGGSDYTVYFEYGTTTAYGSTASASPASVSGTSAVSISANLTGLRLNTLYHYRLVAVSDSGIYYGQDVAFLPRCDSGEVYWGYHEMDFLSQLLPASDPTGNIQIVGTSSDSPAMANFDIYNHNNFDVFLNYDAGVTATGTVAIGQQQNAQIFVPKGSVCSFSYNYTLFKQIVTNDQYNWETPQAQNKIELYSLGYLNRDGNSNSNADVYSINNRNAYAVTLTLLYGTKTDAVTVPANGIVYYVTAASSGELQALYGGNTFAVASPSVVKWYGAALVTAEAQGYGDTSATFRLQNNDDISHSVKLKNAGGVTHAYTLSPYEHRTVTIEKSDWDVYMQLSPLPQPNTAGWVEDGYVKMNSVRPGAAVLPPLSVSGATAFMGAYEGSAAPVYVTGGGAWTAVSDQPWLTVSPAAGRGFGWLTMTASANTSSSSRSAVVTVSDGTTARAVTVTQTAQGRGNALSFDGADDCVSVPDNDNGITDAFTLESWVKWEPGAPADIQFICGKDTEQMELQAGGSANSLRFIPTPGVYLDAAGVLPTGVWTHVAVVYQPSAGLAKMYINGSEVTLTNNGSQPLASAVGNTASSFSLGSRGDGTYRFKGELDDFCIWNRALTQNEIRQNMSNPIGPSGQTGLVSFYSFNQGAAAGDNAGVTALVDETGYRNGSLSGFALSGSASNWVASGAGEGFHTVTVSASSAEGGSASGGGVYSEGASVTVTAAANSGYTFTNWTEGGSPVSTGAAYTFTLGTSDRNLVANFIVIPPVITTGTISGTVTDGTNPISGATVSLAVSGSVYSATTAGGGNYSILNVPAGTGYTVTASKTGYDSGSATNVSVTANTTTSDVNITLTVVSPATHTVSLSAYPSAGGNVTGGGTCNEGVSVTVTATANSGYTFINWTESDVQVSTNAAYTFTMGTLDRNLTANFLANPTYTVTFDSLGGSSVSSINNITSGSKISAPAAPIKTGFTFGGWYKESWCTNAWNFSTDTVTRSITLYAKWTYNGGGGSGGGGRSTPTPIPEPKLTVQVLDSKGNVSGSVNLRLDNNTGIAAFEVNPALLNSTFDKSAADDKGIKTVVINVPDLDGAKAYEPMLPASFVAAGDASKAVKIKTGVATVTIPGNMLNMADTGGVQNVALTIAAGDKSKLDAAVQSQVGNRPVIELNLKVDGKQTNWNNDSAPVTVAVPYTPTAEELTNPESILIWYIDGSGKAISVPNGHYNASAGTVTFTTTHFSYYAVNYNKVSFNDVAASVWYNKAVGFIAARSITTGTDNGNYSPEAKLTRGEFIVMMMRAYGIVPVTSPSDNFSDAGNTYYTGYLAAAKRLGISAGVGSNMFAPGKEITRQEMFTLLYNAMKALDQLPRGNAGKPLSAFDDTDKIAVWAKDAMKLLTEKGMIRGSGGNLSPAGTTTRAEMAQLLYSLLSK